jgi:hypothetical protein
MGDVDCSAVERKPLDADRLIARTGGVRRDAAAEREARRETERSLQVQRAVGEDLLVDGAVARDLDAVVGAGRVDARLQRPVAGRRSGPGVEDRELCGRRSRRDEEKDDRSRPHERRERRHLVGHLLLIHRVERSGQASISLELEERMGRGHRLDADAWR